MNTLDWIEHTVNELGPWGRAVVVGKDAASLADRLAQAYGLRTVAVGRDREQLSARSGPTMTWGTGGSLAVVALGRALPIRAEVATWAVGVGIPGTVDEERAQVLAELRWVTKPNGHVLLVEDIPSSRGADLTGWLREVGLKEEVVRRTEGAVLVLASVALEKSDDPDVQLRRKVMERLAEVIDPETGMDVVTMDMIVDLKVKDGTVDFKFRPTTPYCPIAVHLSIMIKRAVQDVEGVKQVNMTVVDYVDADNLTRELKSI